MLFYILFIIGGIVVDQLTKYLAVTFLSPVTTVPVIPHVFHLTYVENTGAAFSIFAGKQIFLILLTLIFIIVLVYFFVIMPKTKRYFDVNLALSMIISGAVGNLIDRIRLNYVIDFFDVRLIGFAIFNIADIFVVVGCILMVIAIFRNKELLNNPPSLAKKKRQRAAQTLKKPKTSAEADNTAAEHKTEEVQGLNKDVLSKRKPRKRRRNLEPEVKTKIEKLPEHYSSIDLEPGPPPEEPEVLQHRKKKDSED